MRALTWAGGHDVVVADGWDEGMGASLRAGLTALAEGGADAALVTLVDLPDVDAAVLRRVDMPVALIDGARATPHRWASLLCERLENPRP